MDKKNLCLREKEMDYNVNFKCPEVVLYKYHSFMINTAAIMFVEEAHRSGHYDRHDPMGYDITGHFNRHGSKSVNVLLKRLA